MLVVAGTRCTLSVDSALSAGQKVCRPTAILAFNDQITVITWFRWRKNGALGEGYELLWHGVRSDMNLRAVCLIGLSDQCYDYEMKVEELCFRQYWW